MSAQRSQIDRDVINDDTGGSDTALSLQLIRDNARLSLERTRSDIAARGDNGQSLPLPMPSAEEVTLRQSIEAAFFHLEALKRRADGVQDDDCDPLDWSEELLEFVEIAHLSRALKR